MDSISLRASSRQEEAKKVRQENKVPGIIYGHNIKNTPVSFDYLSFQRTWEKAGWSTLVDLAIDDKESVKVIIQDVQSHPLTGKIIHADLLQVKMDEKITTEVDLNFIGESKAVKETGGILVKTMDNIEVECLPANLVHHIEVDISQLENIDDKIHVSDLKVPTGITLLSDPENVVASVTLPQEEEEPIASEEDQIAEVEVAKKGKEEEKEEEKPAEAKK